MQFSTFESIIYISLAETTALNTALQCARSLQLKIPFSTTQMKQDIRDKGFKTRPLFVSWISKLDHKQEPAFPKRKPNTNLFRDTKSYMTASFKKLVTALLLEGNNVIDDERATC